MKWLQLAYCILACDAAIIAIIMILFALFDDER
jgi:hypothetical protein